MITREQPWNSRFVTAEHAQWFRNLVDLHEMTTSWLADLKIDRPPYLLERGPSVQVSETLWMLDLLHDGKLESFLDDTDPSDALGRLEHAIWAAQAWTLVHLFESTSEEQAEVLISALEQTSWKAGRRSAEARWKITKTPQNAVSARAQAHGQALGQIPGMTLRESLLAISDSPLTGYPHTSGFVVRRAVPRQIQLELRACPHHLPYAEVRPAADLLCRIHTHWMRGYLYALNNKISIERFTEACNPADPENKDFRCVQRWFYV